MDLAKATVEVVRLRHLVEFRGTQEKPVRYITLRGLHFPPCRRARSWTTRSRCCAATGRSIAAARVLFDGAEDCAVADCEFDQLGGNAIFVNNYNRRVTIRGCDIHDAGASGVAFVGEPEGRAQPALQLRPTPATYA